MATAITYRSYAKLNLYLDVIKRRRDGYHNIETIFQTVGLHDELRFLEHPSLLTLACNVSELEATDSNLVYRAAVLLKEVTGCPLGARMQLEKRIPIAAGMAGGSGNAAATLTALNSLWDLRLPKSRIHELALLLGSDVPYCVVGGTMTATGRGEQLKPLPPLRRTWFVLLHPAIAVSASRVYNHPKLTFSTEKPFAGWTRRLRRAVHALQEGDFARVVFNRMEEPVFDTHPQLAEAKQRLLNYGCAAAAMSGSGPTLFGICKTKVEAVRVADQFPDYRTSVVMSVPVGLERVD